jgi:hypothetical protein
MKNFKGRNENICVIYKLERKFEEKRAIIISTQLYMNDDELMLFELNLVWKESFTTSHREIDNIKTCDFLHYF